MLIFTDESKFCPIAIYGSLWVYFLKGFGYDCNQNVENENIDHAGRKNE